MKTALQLWLVLTVVGACNPTPAPKVEAGLEGSWIGQPGPGQVTFEFTSGGDVTITSTGQGGGKMITTTEVKGRWKATGKDKSRPSSIEIVHTGGRFVSGNEMARKPFEDTLAKKVGSTLILLVEWTSAEEVKLTPQKATSQDGKSIDPGQQTLTLTRLG